MFLSALIIDVSGHAGKLDAAFEIIQEARNRGIQVGTVSYSSLTGACSNAKNWQKALELYEDLKSAKIEQTVSTVNALITALCDGDQLQKAMEVLSEMKSIGLRPNSITYSILVVASEKKDDLEADLLLLSQAEKDKVVPNLVMCRCIIGKEKGKGNKGKVKAYVQNQTKALNQHVVAVVVDPIQSVKRKVVIDAFRLINPQTMMLGQEPRQTTSNLGHLNKPSIQL